MFESCHFLYKPVVRRDYFGFCALVDGNFIVKQRDPHPKWPSSRGSRPRENVFIIAGRRGRLLAVVFSRRGYLSSSLLRRCRGLKFGGWSIRRRRAVGLSSSSRLRRSFLYLILFLSTKGKSSLSLSSIEVRNSPTLSPRSKRNV